MSKLITADEAAEKVKDGSTVAIGAMGLAGWPEEIAKAIENRFLKSGHPKGLNIKQGAATGDWGERGTTRWGHEGLISKWTGAHIGSSAGMSKLAKENKIQAHCIPQGVIVNLWREIAAHRPGLMTKVGLRTFVDPRIEGGKMNIVEGDDDNLVELIEFQGEEWLFYKSFPVDVALIRGTTIDENGNLTMDNEGFLFEALEMAEAAKNTGGIVIAQAEYLAKAGTLHPKKVKVPGAMIDYIVIAKEKESCWQTEGKYFHPSFSGDLKIPIDAMPKIPMNERKIIARRSALELKKNTIVNLGYGMPADIAAVTAEENAVDLMILTTEAGAFGGVPAGGRDFGHTYNAESLISHGAMFDFYDGGGLDVTFLGMAQADQHGNVNVSKFSSILTGPGGFIDISQNTKKCIFLGTFTNGVEVDVIDGKLVIVKEGKRKKFLSNVEQITFSGSYASQINQPVLYITERAVFTIEEGQMTLIEIAPGIDLETDILQQMDFVPRISPNLRVMDEEIFRPEWGGLKSYV